MKAFPATHEVLKHCMLYLHGFEGSGALLHPLFALPGVRQLVRSGFREQVLLA